MQVVRQNNVCHNLEWITPPHVRDCRPQAFKGKVTAKDWFSEIRHDRKEHCCAGSKRSLVVGHLKFALIDESSLISRCGKPHPTPHALVGANRLGVVGARFNSTRLFNHCRIMSFDIG